MKESRVDTFIGRDDDGINKRIKDRVADGWELAGVSLSMASDSYNRPIIATVLQFDKKKED